MNIKHLLVLIAMLSVWPGISQAKSPWDKTTDESESAPADASEANPQMVEPLEPQAIAGESEMVEPVAAEPIPPMASSPAPVAAPKAPETIEVIETTGDVLAMPQPTQSEIAAGPMLLLDFPRRGMDQDKVQSELGNPMEIIDPVGQPPITRWIYSDRVVYFERSTVLHVVAR